MCLFYLGSRPPDVDDALMGGTVATLLAGAASPATTAGLDEGLLPFFPSHFDLYGGESL
jgi:hypothetical protein